jgi:hypothetical protein
MIGRTPRFGASTFRRSESLKHELRRFSIALCAFTTAQFLGYPVCSAQQPVASDKSLWVENALYQIDAKGGQRYWQVLAPLARFYEPVARGDASGFHNYRSIMENTFEQLQSATPPLDSTLHSTAQNLDVSRAITLLKTAPFPFSSFATLAGFISDNHNADPSIIEGSLIKSYQIPTQTYDKQHILEILYDAAHTSTEFRDNFDPLIGVPLFNARTTDSGTQIISNNHGFYEQTRIDSILTETGELKESVAHLKDDLGKQISDAVGQIGQVGADIGSTRSSSDRMDNVPQTASPDAILINLDSTLKKQIADQERRQRAAWEDEGLRSTTYILSTFLPNKDDAKRVLGSREFRPRFPIFCSLL